MELQSVIPANNVVAITNGVAAFFTLLLQDNELRLVKYSEERSVIWCVLLASYEGRGGANCFSLIEDEQSYIYVIANYSGIFKPYVNQLKDGYGAIVLKLNSWGQVINSTEFPHLTNFVSFLRLNDAWLVSNYQNARAIQIQNLTTGGKITHIVTTGFLDLGNIYYLDANLFITANVQGTISYRTKSITFEKVSAVLLIINTIDWQLVDYYHVGYTGMLYLTATYSLGKHYFIAGYTNTDSLELYHRNQLIKQFNFEHPTLFVCRFNREKVRIFHMEYTSPSEQRFNFVEFSGELVLQGIAKLNSLEKSFRQQYSRQQGLCCFLIKLNKRLELTKFMLIGSGSEALSKAACDCGNCGDDDKGLLIPCRPMRLFNGQQLNTNAMGGCGQGGSNGNTNVDGVYICEETVKHCYAATGRQPGDLYNTKYNNSLTAAEKQVILAPTESLNGLQPASANPFLNKTILSYNNNLLIGMRLIDNLVINNRLERKLYSQKWFGFLLNFQ